MRKTIINSALLVGVFVIGIIMMEAAIRMLFPIYDPSGQVEFVKGTNSRPPLGELTTELRQTKLAGDYDVSVSFNEYGLRDRHNLAMGTAADMYVVGDSFSFGWGVEASERYSNALETLSGRRTFNVAIPGDFDAYHRLLSYAESLGADVKNIIIGVCMENDLHLYDDPAYLISSDQITTPAITGINLHTLKEYLTTRSAIYKLVASSIHQSNMLKQLAINLGLIVEINNSIPAGTINDDRIFASVRKLKQISTSYNATVLIIPSRALWTGKQIEAADKAHTSFVTALKAAKFKVIDMRPIFETHGNPMKFHFMNDGHWTPKAHALAASALYESIKENPQ
jgi:hypothetical protein